MVCGKTGNCQADNPADNKPSGYAGASNQGIQAELQIFLMDLARKEDKMRGGRNNSQRNNDGC
jgi:hypothetical protein